MDSSKKLRRSRTNKQLAGVCGGLAGYFGISAKRLRVMFFIVILFSGFTGFWIYLFLWMVIPLEEIEEV